MNFIRHSVLPVLIATIWISINEFARNEILLKSLWTGHYEKVAAIPFPSDPINGAVWGIWSLVFALVIRWISKGNSFKGTVLTSWVVGFVLMWLVVGNMGVLPYDILPYALPWSFAETLGATFIIFKMKKSS